MPTEACPFCGSTGPFSREHWLPRDWGEYFPRLPGLVSANRDYDDEQTRVFIENRSHFDRQFSGICRRCNNEWLREIDVAAKNVALDLALRHRVHVSANEVVTLASSLYRAGLIGMWGQRQQHGLPEGRFSEFWTLRRPPAGAHILLGHSDEGYLFAGGHYSAVTADGTNETAVRSLAFGGIGHLFVVVLLSVPELDATVARVARAMKSAADGTLVSLWPNKRRRVTLPTRPITHEIALRSAELGVVLGMREPTAPDLQAQGRLMDRYPTSDTIRKQLRPATRTHLPPEARR